MRHVLSGTFRFLLLAMAAAGPSEAAPEGQVTPYQDVGLKGK